MAAYPTTFGSNLPANFRNLAGVSVANTGGGAYEVLPPYLQKLLLDSQNPTASAATATASPASSPSVAAPAAPTGYALVQQDGAPGMGGISLRRGNGPQPRYQIPLSELANLPGGYSVMGTSADALPNIQQATIGNYTDPLTGAHDSSIFMRNPNGAYENAITGGLATADKLPDWKFNSPATVKKDPSDNPATDPTTGNTTPTGTTGANQVTFPYVTSEVPDAFKYAQGGLVESAQELQSKGRMGDTMLAHISPDEARMLKMAGGAGTINPETGLPEYFSFKKLLGAALPVIGNAIAPGIGGIIGGAAGGALSGGGIEGALMGGLGAGLGNLGGSVLGGGFPSGGFSIANLLGGLTGGGGGGQQKAAGSATQWPGDYTNLPAVQSGGSNLDLGSLLRLGATVASGFANDTTKNNRKLLQEQEAMRQAKQDAESKDFQERISADLQNKRSYVPPPSGYYTYGNMPEHKFFTDFKPVMAAKGGYIGERDNAGGQDDTIPARLSNNEYVIPADVVAHLGDGVPKVGAMKLDELLTSVRKHKGGSGHPPKAKPVKQYMGGLASGR